MEVLAYLAARPEGEVVTAEELIKAVWRGRVVGDGAIYRAVNQLRQALGDHADDVRYIQTIPKRGYRLVAAVTRLGPPLSSVPGSGRSQADTWTSAPRQAWHRFGPFAGAAIVAVAIVEILFWSGTQPGSAPVARFNFQLPDGQRFRSTGGPLVSISPDGRQIAYNAHDGIFLRAMDDLEPRLIPGTEAGPAPPLTSPLFSPDGLAIAYWEADQLKRIALRGGPPVVISGVQDLYGLSWHTDGMILFGLREGILRVSAQGGTPEVVIPLEDVRHYGAELLPDTDSVLFSVTDTSDWDASQIVLQSLSTGERKVLIEGGNDARYLRSGHIVYVVGDTLFAVPFDPDTLTISGTPRPVVRGIMRAGARESGAANYAVSDNGTLVYVSGYVTPDTRTLVWVDRQGREEPIDSPPRAYTTPRISPDGTKIAVNARDQEQDIWTWDFARETLTRVTFNPGQDRFPVWSPDGKRIAYSSRQEVVSGESAMSLTWLASDGSDSAKPLGASSGQLFPASFLPDATGLLVFGASTASAADQNDDIAVFNLGQDGGEMPLIKTPFSERDPELSPDGRWIAYTSDESGHDEVYVRPFPDVSAGRWQVSRGGGIEPLWARSGRELFYRYDKSLLAVAVEMDSTFSAGDPAILFEGKYFGGRGGRAYDIAPDGERFLMIKELDNTSSTAQIVVVLNWFDELKQLVSAAE